jgi:peptidoglycan hydrolase CwlO-like protein
VKNEALIVAGIALAVLYLAAQAKKAAGDAADAVLQSAQDLWDAAQKKGAAAVAATVEAVTPAGASLYDQRPAKNGAPKTQYTPGDINDGPIF